VKLRYITFALLLLGVGLTSYFLGRLWPTRTSLPTPTFIAPRTLDKYSLENLAKTEFQKSPITLGEKLFESSSYSAYLFSFLVDADLDQRAAKKVSGLINLPKGEGQFPAIILFRGYVDQETYTSGSGSKRAGEYFAENGFITLAPDFLGYGSSDKEAENIFEARFQTYVTALSLIESLDSVSGWDGKNIFIWGHSNGGQIAIALLEVSQKPYPTVLWAPVSKPFPYSVLYYTDESDDGGKLIRRELATFEDTYNVDYYSITNYFDRIKAPISLHQGTSDIEVPRFWSDELAEKLKDLVIDFEYATYPGADHNLNPSWNSAISKSLNFYRKHLK
jgi:dipeptidyl aminopeptidase/acylaminoacyl peptidase